jgi:hypothetical protein
MAAHGVDGDYEALSNKPAIDGSPLAKDSTAAGLGLATSQRLSDLELKIEAVEGRGGYLTACDFGTAAPSQHDLTAYALEQTGVTDPLDIWNGTHVRNIYTDPNTGQLDGHVWALTNTPDTRPPIFEWVDDGPEGIGQATNARYGAVKGTADPGDGRQAGFVMITSKGMKVIGFDKIGGGDYSTTRQPVMINSNGVIRQKLSVDGYPIWVQTFNGQILGVSDFPVQEILLASSAVNGIYSVSGWWNTGSGGPDVLPVNCRLQQRSSDLDLAYSSNVYRDQAGDLIFESCSASARAGAGYQITVEFTEW